VPAEKWEEEERVHDFRRKTEEDKSNPSLSAHFVLENESKELPKSFLSSKL